MLGRTASPSGLHLTPTACCLAPLWRYVKEQSPNPHSLFEFHHSNLSPSPPVPGTRLVPENRDPFPVATMAKIVNLVN